MNGPEIRSATLPDIEAIFALERATPTAPHWPKGAYQAILAAEIFSPCRCLLVAAVKGQPAVLGFAVGVVHPAGDSELESVVVVESFRRRGTGTALCAAVAEWCRQQGARELLLEVRASSTGAIALYKRLGFDPVGSRPRYYHQPVEDAVVMRRLLRAEVEHR